MSTGYDQFFKNAKKSAKAAGGREKSAALHRIRKRRPQFPIQAFVALVATTAVGTGIVLYPDQLESLLEKVEIRFMGMAAANDGVEKSSETKGEKKAESAATSSRGSSRHENANSGDEPEDHSYLAKLNDRKRELDLREKELSELEEELHKQRVEVEERIRKLEEIRTQISNVLKERVNTDQEKVDKLVEFYSNMKPKQAADILGTINEDLAVEVLGKMKKKNAAEIMNLLTPNKAQVISEKFAGYKRR